MRLRQRVRCVAALLSFVAAQAHAQTLTEALVAAYQTNPGLLAARSQLRATDEGVSQALAGWRPSVIVEGSYGPTSFRSRNRTETDTGIPLSVYSHTFVTPASGDVTVSQPLYQGGRTLAQTRQAEAAVMAQRARLLATEQQVLFDTAAGYVAMVRDQQLLQLNTSNVELLKKQLDATNRRLSAGDVTRTDVAQAETRLAAAQVALSAAAASLETSRAAYIRVVGTPPGTLVSPQPLELPFNTVAAVQHMAEVDSPTVVAALFDNATARHAIDVQFAQLLPNVTLQGQAYRDDNASDVRGERVRGVSLTVNLSVPLYQGGAEYSAVRQAREQARQTSHTLDDQRRVAVQSGVQAFQQLVAARQQVIIGNRAVRTALQALDGVQREAVIGSRTTLDALNAQLELLDAREQLVQSVATVVIDSYSLAQATGRLTAQDLGLPLTPLNWEPHFRQSRESWAGLGG